jgi:inner membrane protein involved in colicin E2 resistance
MYQIDIHPMHYLFVAAGFFAFHLLLSYLVGLVNLHLSFIVSAVISVGLVTGYLAAALGKKFPWKIAIAGQFFFLVLFSYSFFIKGITGLTVAIGSVITLGVLMRVTARVDWNEVFTKHGPAGDSSGGTDISAAAALAPEGPPPL